MHFKTGGGMRSSRVFTLSHTSYDDSDCKLGVVVFTAFFESSYRLFFVLYAREMGISCCLVALALYKRMVCMVTM